MGQSVLTLESVSFEHEGVLLLEEINLDFLKGKTYLLTSEPDGGKSLLLKIAGGIIKPATGFVRLQGMDVYHGKRGKDLTKKIGSVFQESTLISNLSIEENLLLPIRYLDPDYNDDQVKLKIHDLFRNLEISIDTLGKRPANVSYSTKKLVNFVRAVITGPVIFLIDAPLFNLNAVDRKKIHDRLIDLKRQGETLVIASNDRYLIKDLADEVILLGEGRVAEQCQTEDFLQSNKPLIVNYISHHIGG